MSRYLAKHPVRSKLFNELVIKSWWVVLFLLTALFIFESAFQKKCHEEVQLKRKYNELLKERDERLVHQKTLREQIVSLSDPDWIEIILKKELGLVSEGETKVLFLPSAQGSK